MKQLTVIWFNRQKGFGEGFDDNGEVIFFTAYHLFEDGCVPKPNATIKVKGLNQ